MSLPQRARHGGVTDLGRHPHRLFVAEAAATSLTGFGVGWGMRLLALWLANWE